MENFLKTIERLANLKGIAALLVVLLLSYFVYRNFDFISEITFKVDKPKKEHQVDSLKKPMMTTQPGQQLQKGGYAELELLNLQLSPVDFNLPNFFYFELHNKGTAPAQNLVVRIDLGKATVKEIEITCSDTYEILSNDLSTSIIKAALSSIAQEESAYFYLLLSTPTFKKIIASAENIPLDLIYSVDNYRDNSSETEFVSSNLMSFLRFAFGAAVGVFGIYFIVVIITLLNRVFKIDDSSKPGEIEQKKS